MVVMDVMKERCKTYDVNSDGEPTISPDNTLNYFRGYVISTPSIFLDLYIKKLDNPSISKLVIAYIIGKRGVAAWFDPSSEISCSLALTESAGQLRPGSVGTYDIQDLENRLGLV